MALQEQSHLLSFSVERLLQQSRRHSKSSSTCESPSSTPPSSPPLLLSQPREIMVNAGVTALPLSFGMPLSSTTTWNPAFNAWSVLGLPMAYKPLVNSTWNFQPSSIQQQSLSLLNTKKKMDHTDIARNDDEVEDEDSCSDISPEPSSPTSDDAIVMESGPIEDKTSKKYKKKKRTTFTSSQLQQLENRFSQQKYLTKVDRCRLAQMIGLTEKHVKTWYQNRRTKWKRDCTDEVWSREREHAATNMYTQHLQMKTVNSSLQSSSKPYTLVNV